MSALGDGSGDASPAGRRFDVQFWLVAVAVMGATFLLRTTYIVMNDVTNGRVDTVSLRLFEEVTGTLAAIPLVLLAARAGRRAPLPPHRSGWGGPLLWHGSAFAAGTAVHTLLIAASRAALAPLLGLAGYGYGALHLRLIMEAPNDLIYYAIIVAARVVTDSRRRAIARERRALELERELAQSRLENLQLQLQPHFLFNALNTISSVMYDDAAAADRMLGHLSDLLRHALGRAGAQEIPLPDELLLLESYLALARARFGEQLDLSIDVEGMPAGATVPPLLLQPLVENAIRHGVAPSGAGQVAVRAAQVGDRLVLLVENDVPPRMAAGVTTVPPHADGHGMGLAVTTRRLALLYGDSASLDAGPTADGGFRVAVSLPLRQARIAEPRT